MPRFLFNTVFMIWRGETSLRLDTLSVKWGGSEPHLAINVIDVNWVDLQVTFQALKSGKKRFKFHECMEGWGPGHQKY